MSCFRHGEGAKNSKTPEYVAWLSMRKRCNSPNNKAFPEYGGRGIRICKQWDDYRVFLSDMGRKPSPNHTLERIKNNHGYSRRNCKWALQVDQVRNRRNTLRIKLGNRSIAIATALENIGMKANQNNIMRVKWRLSKGWNPKDALHLPAMESRK